MQKKFQIFVSSTFVDLEDERRAVIEAILDLGHIPIGMEAFQAGNEEQWGYIKKRIDESDYYVVLVAERYGSEKDGVSYTEMEYDYARSQGVPVAAFLLAEDVRAQWKRDKAEFIDNTAKVTAFRKKCEGLMVRYWKNKDELAAACVTSLTKMFVNAPRDGWVPAKQAANPDVANELARLSEENKKLRENVNRNDMVITEIINEINMAFIDVDERKVKIKDILISARSEFITGFRINPYVGKVRFLSFESNGVVKIKYKDGHRTDRNIFLFIEKLVILSVIFRIGDVDCYEFTDIGKQVIRRITQMQEEQAVPT